MGPARSPSHWARWWPWISRDSQEPNERIVREGNRFARALDAAGVAPRDGIAALLPNVPETLFAYRGAGWSGRVWTPICWHWTVDEVRYVVGDSEARAFLDQRVA